MIKRFIDIVGAGVGGFLLCPLLVAVWIAVVLESGLPGLFRQRRVGRGKGFNGIDNISFR